MYKRFFYIILIVFIWACSRTKKPSKPDNLLSEKEMINIITDISLANAAKGVQKKVIESNQINLEEYVFKKYNIDSTQFAESNNYYAYDIETYEDIYEHVRQNLEKKKQEYIDLEKEKLKEKDSIRKVEKSKRDSLKSRTISKKPNSQDLLKKENISQQ